MPPRPIQRSDDIDLKSVWQAVTGSFRRLVVISVVLAGATFGVLKMMAPLYVSETQLAIESKSTNNPFSDPSRNGSSDSVSVRMDKEAVNTHVRALMSTDLAETIVREMKLADLPEFNSARGSPDALSGILRLAGIGAPRANETDQDRALRSFLDRLEVYSPKESRFIGIRFTSIDPDLAAAIANRVAETYRNKLAQQSLTETDDVQKALAPKIEELAQEAARAESEVEKFRGEANIFKGGQQATGLNEQQLAELNAELSKVKASRSEAEARAKQAREMQDLGSAETLADVQKSPLIQNLVQSRVRVERQISELSATLLSGHPRMRQLHADLTGLKGQIAGEVAKIVDGIGKEAKVAALREEAVEKSVSDIKRQIVGAGPEEAKLRSLEADAKSKRGELDRLRAQYEANRVRADDTRTIPVEAQIVSSARPSTVPFFPKRGATALLVAIASFLIGLALVVTKALLSESPVARQGRKGPQNRREFAPVLPEPPPSPAPPAPRRGTPQTYRADPLPAPSMPAPPMPEVAHAAAPAASHAAPPVSISTADALAGSVEGLRKGNLAGVRTLFVGASDVFSLATESAAFCRRLAEKGLTVIMVDWSPAGSGVAEPLGQASWPGFSELLDGKARFEDVVLSLHDSDVHLIPSGQRIDLSATALDSDSVNFLLDALDDVYDHIVVVSHVEPAKDLFEAMQGRFDCGVVLVEDKAQKAKAVGAPGTFLGYEVDGIALFAFEKQPEANRTRQKFARAS
ncbi:GumC family protein [Hyphomicrobium sp.]|uniref:GumC family protein n=1 Tax=Hyphomicrobium sp. TaxID=82 RepID=UPI003F7005FD